MKAEAIQQELAHVYWLGGSPCAGKSSVADALVAKYGWQLYRCDEAYECHISVVTPELQPIFSKLSTLSGDALWIRPAAQQLSEEIQLYQEEFPLILADLLALPKTAPVLVEGNALLPHLLAPLLTTFHQALWMVPVPEFQMKHYLRREWAQEVVAACTHPEQAFANWMQRDISFAAYVTQKALEQGLSLVQIDGSHSLEETIKMIDRHFHVM
ncbi:hypothetical protein KSC_021330 [Ktedonobacter sp. SOSP1-52]|uniref:hypothetical protein n=1 Tax=Ktedonobacter sp. SOSP1-52 TaxID=2778366 RepID=UPI001915F56C|nr:hypothetical protein [Ktedonobacter sp. SOSP1-52]GHO63241.1 hypothetical protein KSC_021330 [Ktedonobacter sp. SOSP1-52]